jgi:octaprenyl-diphosphate synthase
MDGFEALKAIPASRYRDALELIINYTVERNK